MPKSKPESVCSTTVRLLKQKRIALGLSMNVVSKRAHISHSMISRIEHELRRPTLEMLMRIASAMEIELWPLIKEAEIPSATEKKNV